MSPVELKKMPDALSNLRVKGPCLAEQARTITDGEVMSRGHTT